MSVRGPEGGEWGCGVLLNFSALTLYTGASEHRIDIGPNETRSDEFLGGTDSWVR